MVALLSWAAVYEPATAVPEPTTRRAVKAISLSRTSRPAPVKEPEPKPEPEPEPKDLPQPEPEPELPPPDRPRGPPPPPAACNGCAMTPAALGVPKNARSAASRAIPMGVPGGVPGGVLGGVPGGVVGGVLGGDPNAIGTGSLTPARPAEPPKPLEAVMEQAIFTPDPDAGRLAKTNTGMFDRHGGVNRTAFCIDRRGKTVSVRTAKRFPRDPQVDTICRDAIKRWRFRPFLVAGRPTQVCTVAEFEIHFD